MKKPLDLTLYLVTDSTGFTTEVFLTKLEQALAAGVTLLQLREKNRTGKELYELALQAAKLAKKYDVPLLIDDRVDIALAVDADGVHVGQEDLPVHAVRQLLGPDKIIGATAKTVEAAKQACAEGADYLGVGAIFPTTTKVKTQITSVQTVKAIASMVPIPFCAIGGLNASNMHVLAGSGINGICVVSAIMQSDAIPETVAHLKQTIQNIL